MQTLLDKIDHIDMLISSEYDLDEMVREFIPSPAGEEKVKRIYWVYHGLDHEGTSHIEEISKEEYEANKDDENYYTSLNYHDFEFNKDEWKHYFNQYRYSLGASIEYFIVDSLLDIIGNIEEYKAKVLCKQLFSKIEESYFFLESVVNANNRMYSKKNEIHKFVASHFLDNIAQPVYTRVKDEISNIFPEFIEKRKGVVENITTSKIEPSASYKSKIFRNQKAEDWFYEMLEEFGVSKGEWRFGAVTAGIFRNSNCKNHILKSHLKQKEYIQYLNERFNKTMPLTNFSNSDNYSNDIEKYIQLHINSSSE